MPWSTLRHAYAIFGFDRAFHLPWCFIVFPPSRLAGQGVGRPCGFSFEVKRARKPMSTHHLET